jgi:hypothetical protein
VRGHRPDEASVIVDALTTGDDDGHQ